MSAIAGLVALDGGFVEAGRLQRIAQAIPYLRTDSVGEWHADDVGLLHFAFATTPQSVDEVQPTLDPVAGTAIVFDGRLDNRNELLRELRTRGLSSESPDAQIVQALFERYGDQCPHRLVGDYAFAIWQRREHRLFCARSPLGWRTLVWCRSGGVFAFGTEIKSLLDGLPMQRRPNEGALAELLSLRFVTPTETIWHDIYRIPAGAALEVVRGTVRCWHWHVGPFPASTASAGELAEQFLALFDDAISACTRSSTEVGAQLSGGLDSSSIVCRATQLHRAGRIDRQIRPISVRFPGDPHDESEYSEAVTRFTGADALIARGGPFCWDRAREWCASTLHLPLRPNVISVMLPTFERARAEGMRAILTGEGGDDWLAGSSAPPGAGVLPLISRRRRAQVVHPHLEFSLLPPAWIQAEWAASVDLPGRWRSDESPVKLPSFEQRSRFARYTLARPHVNVDNLLALAAQQGIELRHPFHDLRMTHFLMGVPSDALRRDGERKSLLRVAMRGSLPETVRTRQTKTGFGSAVLRALDQLLAGTTVGELRPVSMGWVNPAGFEHTVARWRSWYESGQRGPRPEQSIAPIWFTAAVHTWLEHAAG